MNKVFLSTVLLAFILLTGCGKKETVETKPETTQPPVTTPTIPPVATETQKQIAQDSKEEKKEPEATKKDTQLRDKSGAIRVRFPAGSTEVTLNGEIKKFGEKVTYVFEAGPSQKLFATVLPDDGKGVIRISQIFTPTGRADGPFGTKAKYTLEDQGDYKLIVSENQMAGDPWKGTYKLTIQIIK